MAISDTINLLAEQNGLLGDIFEQGERIDTHEVQQTGVIANLLKYITGQELGEEEYRRDTTSIFSRIYLAIRHLDSKLGTNIIGSTSKLLKKLISGAFWVGVADSIARGIVALIKLPVNIANFIKSLRGVSFSKAVVGFKRFTDWLSKIAFTIGNTERMLKIRLKFLAFTQNLTKLLSTFANTDKVLRLRLALISVGEAFTKVSKALRGPAKALGKAGVVLGKIGWSISKVMLETAAWVAKFFFRPLTRTMAAIRPILPYLKKAQGIIGKFAPLLKPFSFILKAVLRPIFLIMGVFKGIQGFLKGYQEGGLIEGFKQGIKSFLQTFVGDIVDMLAHGVAKVLEFVGQYVNIPQGVIDFFKDFSFEKIFDSIVSSLGNMWDAANKWTEMFFGDPMAKIEEWFGPAIDAIKDIFDHFADVFSKVKEWAVEKINGLIPSFLKPQSAAGDDESRDVIRRLNAAILEASNANQLTQDQIKRFQNLRDEGRSARALNELRAIRELKAREAANLMQQQTTAITNATSSAVSSTRTITDNSVVVNNTAGNANTLRRMRYAEQ